MRALLTIVSLIAATTAAAQPTSTAPVGGAQQPPRPRSALPNPADLEPAVDVGGPRVATATRPTPPSAPTAPKAAQAAAPKPPAPGAPATSGDAAKAGSGRAMDRLDLGTTSITGNSELPKVLYIVPWKKSDLGDLVGRPVNTLLDEVLAPVDPAVFQRHLSYYDSLYGKSKQEE